MNGVSYVVDKYGRRNKAVINLRKHGRLWEDFHDALLADCRRNEPRENVAAVRKALHRSHKKRQRTAALQNLAG